MNILFTRFPLESRMGGTEVQTLSLMKGLIKEGHNVSFLGSCPILGEDRGQSTTANHILNIGIPPVTKFGVISFLWRKNAMKKKLSSFISHHSSFDAVVMLSLSEKLLLTSEAVKRGMKVIWVEHDPVGRWLSKNPWLPTLRSLSQKVTTIVVSDVSKKIYEGLGYKNVKVIPNGIDLERFAKSENRKANDSSQLQIGVVARLAEEKGVDVLLEAVRELPQVSLTIVGEGPEESFLRNFINDISAREGITPPRISLLKNVADLGSFYKSLDVFVLPSRTNDPFGLAAAEAMSMGIATIVTDACGIAGYLAHNTNVMIAKAGDATSLKESIEALMDQTKRAKVAEEGKRTAHEKFSAEKMVQSYEALLH